ncbi:MAG: DUF4249 family protein [Bacteroidetes bacterium]|nr:DUF4249 family protein [Bacteroidota bacterium]
MSALLVVCSTLFFTTCAQTFEPLAENKQYYFSIYGYLDAAVDTQWVRVGTAREAIDDVPDPSGITVRLENLQTGESIEMQDSLFSPENFLNYWATFDIEIKQVYRILVEGTDGKSSHADVTIPGELPTPLVLVNTFPPFGYSVYIDDVVEHVADIQTKRYVILNPETDPLRKVYTFTYRPEVEHVEVYGGSYTIFAPLEDEEGHIEASVGINDYEVVHRQVLVAAAGPEWDDEISTIGDLEYFINSTSSNVVNGLGYVVGIDSKWVPYRSCKNEDESLAVPCPEEEPFW